MAADSILTITWIHCIEDIAEAAWDALSPTAVYAFSGMELAKQLGAIGQYHRQYWLAALPPHPLAWC
jgi:hypothetical protein